MADMFTDGEIVATFSIPKEVIGSIYTKKEWGAKALASYVAQLFGDRAKLLTEESRSRNGSLTGTKVVINKDDKQIIYMLVEPTEKYQEEVLVSRLEVDLKDGDFLDAIDYKYSDEGIEARKPLGSPFAVLSGVKHQLPRKKKNPGAPKKKRFRW